ncbi:XK-related protein 5-like [Osmerus eperlanus]|uniref:XK-related protein 5-like n=1 Tax=Osmerus eperlanus TaxID=29151 RepID=UPI002E1661E6
MRDYSGTREMGGRGGSCVACCQVCIYAFTAFLIVAERTALIYCFVYYLWVGHNYCYGQWAGLTALLLLPGWGPQLLSYLWYLCDGRIPRKSLHWTHILHLGIFKRLWECMFLPGFDLSSDIMQQADVSALRLLEALVVTLPQTVLQTYVLICTDIGLFSPVPVCFVVCLLSLSWALVLYARACYLIRPGHLPMTPAAMSCRLLWRVSMIGARLATLMLFTRLFRSWVLGVIGLHWMGATFWLVSQQTDIIRTVPRWRLFNVVLGAIHIFLFLNVKDGPSRYRMAGFYLAMFVENALLLLAGSDFFSVATWDSMGIPAAVFCSFLIGVIALVLYYRFLHPKSFEIFQSLRHRGVGGMCMERGSTLSLEEKTTPTSHRHATLVGGGTLLDLPGQWEGWKHHHWLLIRLALKTGNAAKISSCYGEGGLAGLMGLEERRVRQHSPDVPQLSLPHVAEVPHVPQVPQVEEVEQLVDVPQVTVVVPTREVVREVRQAPPPQVQEFRVHKVKVQDSKPSPPPQDDPSPPLSEEREDDEYQSAAYCSPTPSPPLKPSLRHIDSNGATTPEGSLSVASLEIKDISTPERRPSLFIGSPERNLNPIEPMTGMYFSTDAPSPSTGSYLGWGSELSPMSSYRSPYRIREPRLTSTPRQEPQAEIPEEPGLAPPSTSHARKQMVQFVNINTDKLI